MSANLPPSAMPPTGPLASPAAAPGAGRFKPIDPVGVLRRHLWLLVALVVLGVGGGAGAWYALRQLNPWYASEALVHIAPVNPDAWAGLGDDMGALRMDVAQAALENEQLRLRSEQTLRAALERPMVRDTAWFASFRSRDGGTVDAPAALESLRRKLLRTQVVSGSTQMRVSVRTPRAEDAQPILRAVLDTYLSRVRSEREDESRGVRQVYLTERDRAEQQIDQLQQRIERFPREAGLAGLETDLEEAQATWRELTSEHATVRSELTQARQRHETLRQRQVTAGFEPSAGAMLEVEARPAVQRLDQHLQSLRTERRRLEARFGPEHHRIRDLVHRIEAADTQRQQTVERLLQEQHQARLEQSAQIVDTLERQSARLESELEIARARVHDLNQRLTEQHDRYQQLRDRLELARASHQRYDQQLTELRVQSMRPDAVRAQEWAAPSSPRLASPQPEIVIPAVAVVVIALGVGGLMLRESLDQRLHRPSDVKLVRDTELLGTIPHAHEDPSGTDHIEHAVDHYPTGLLAEAFRQVRTALVSKMERDGHKTLLIAGAQPGAGTSAIAHNLACSLAQQQRNVLLIDANIRRPGQHALCGIRQAPGLTDVLRGACRSEYALVSLQAQPLSVLPAGGADDPSQAMPELLGGDAFGELIDHLQRRYDLIVLDAPPVLLASDTQLLARHVDAAALIVRADRDHRGMIERMLGQMTNQRAQNLGLILNGARSSAGGYFRQSYREFYRYHADGIVGHNGRPHHAARPRSRATEPEHAERT